MNAKLTLDTDMELFAAMLCQAKVSIWKRNQDQIPELVEYAARIEKYTPEFVKVRYADGDVSFFRRMEYDFFIVASKTS